tara:strand:+ start:546 stop:719 length:174 start_codon:yes stop_codon:yes gene_type:complete
METKQMTYFESAEDIIITKKEAIKEIREHGASPHEFFEEMGTHEEYEAQAVLAWLGY